MTDEKLGRMTAAEVMRACEDHYVECQCQTCKELDERSTAYNGKPGVSPLLSRRVVREMRGLLATLPPEPESEMGMKLFPILERHHSAFNEGIEAAARWLLALDSDASSPLEDES